MKTGWLYDHPVFFVLLEIATQQDAGQCVQGFGRRANRLGGGQAIGCQIRVALGLLHGVPASARFIQKRHGLPYKFPIDRVAIVEMV